MFDFAEFYYEHNGKKFRVHYEATRDAPCARTGMDWYQSLSIMTPDGTWKQVADAEIVGAVSHYTLRDNYQNAALIEKMLADAEIKFKSYIEKIW